MKTGKAPRPDGMTTEIVKVAVHTVPELILATFNNLLQRQTFPEEWKIRLVVLIPKPGKAADLPSSFRPITLLNSMSKLLEHIIAARINTNLTGEDAISPKQFGFRPGKSTVDAIKKVLNIAAMVCNEHLRYEKYTYC